MSNVWQMWWKQCRDMTVRYRDERQWRGWVMDEDENVTFCCWSRCCPTVDERAPLHWLNLNNHVTSSTLYLVSPTVSRTWPHWHSTLYLISPTMSKIWRHIIHHALRRLIDRVKNLMSPTLKCLLCVINVCLLVVINGSWHLHRLNSVDVQSRSTDCFAMLHCSVSAAYNSAAVTYCCTHPFSVGLL